MGQLYHETKPGGKLSGQTVEELQGKMSKGNPFGLRGGQKRCQKGGQKSGISGGREGQEPRGIRGQGTNKGRGLGGTLRKETEGGGINRGAEGRTSVLGGTPTWIKRRKRLTKKLDPEINGNFGRVQTIVWGGAFD